MKSCAYCGQQNEDAAVRCKQCGTSEFINRQSAALPGGELENVVKPEVLPRDSPKLVIVIGLWMIYGAGLIGNLVALSAAINGRIDRVLVAFCLPLSAGGAVLCMYVLWRSVRNYHIQKMREAEESLALSLEKEVGR